MREGTNVRRHDPRGACLSFRATEPASRSGTEPAAASDAPGTPTPPAEAADRPNTTPQLGPDGQPRRRRRRGSRGGRNRKKPASGAAANGASATDDGDDDEIVLPDDEHDAGADRGLTTDDVAAVAKEDAGLPATPVVRSGTEPGVRSGTEPVRPGAAPRIGDSRPAPRIGDSRPAATATPGASESGAGTSEPGTAKRRRRRGGRGRRSGGGGQGGQVDRARERGEPQHTGP